MMPTGDLDPRFYKSYSMNAPLRTHWRAATCEEVDCADYLNGFVLHCDLGTELGQKQLAFIRGDRSRSPKAEKVGGTLVDFFYPPGTECFASTQKLATHRVPIGRPPVYLVADGDWRGNPTGRIRRHRNGGDWAEDFAENVDRFRTMQQRG